MGGSWKLIRVAAVASVLAAALTTASEPEATPVTPSPCVVREVSRGGDEWREPSWSDGQVTIASLNAHGEPLVIEALARWVKERSIDVLLLQEVGGESLDGASFASEAARLLSFSYSYVPARDLGDGEWQGLSLLSRYPLRDVQAEALDHFRLMFRSRCRVALGGTVETPAGAFRIVNVHLDTRINSRARITQLTTALEGLDAYDGPALVGGDFNTMNIGWAWSTWPFPFLQRQVRAVRESLVAHGFHTPFERTPATFRLLGLPLKLDWIYLRGLTSLQSGVDDLPHTDHRGIWAEVVLRQPAG